jgi:predicted Zn-dependent protease
LFKDALEHSRAALAALPNDERLLDATGRAQLLSGDVEQAASTFRSLANLMPQSAAPMLQLARVYNVQGRRDAVINALQRAVELEPTNEGVQQAYVDLLLASRQAAQATAHVRRLRETRPTEPVSYVLAAMVQERNREAAAAAATLREGLARTGSPELAGKLLALLMRSGQDAEAGSFIAQWQQRNPDDLAFEYIVAERDIVKGDLKKAEERLRRVERRYPGNVLALNNLAWVVASLGGADAVMFARRAVSISPERPDLLDTLAFALSASGKHQEAMAVQRRAVELAPDAAVFRLGLARVAQAAGDAALARSELAMVKKLDAKLGAGKAARDIETKL